VQPGRQGGSGQSAETAETKAIVITASNKSLLIMFKSPRDFWVELELTGRLGPSRHSQAKVLNYFGNQNISASAVLKRGDEAFFSRGIRCMIRMLE
jgi:hypothetical protein